MKAYCVPLYLNSEGTFHALCDYLTRTWWAQGIARYTLNDAGRDVLNNQNGVKQS